MKILSEAIINRYKGHKTSLKAIREELEIIKDRINKNIKVGD